MAKQIGIYRYSGNLGGATGMKGRNGESYLRITVKPANPNSDGQVEQRAKMTLATKISSLIPAEALLGMSGSSKLVRRNNFVSAIVKNAAYDETTHQATIALNRLKLSDGSTPLPAELTTSLAGGILTVGMAAADWTANPDLAAVIVVALFATSGQDGKFDMSLIKTLTNTTQSAAMTVPENHVPAVYAIPVFKTPGASNVSYEEALDFIDGTTDAFGAVANVTTSGVTMYGASQFVGVVNP